MKASRFSEEQIIAVWRAHAAGGEDRRSVSAAWDLGRYFL